MAAQGDMTLSPAASPVRASHFAWAALVLAIMIGAIVAESVALLNFLHVMSGLLWTGIDLFMGFVVGPILRRLPIAARRAVVLALVPRTLILMPVLSTVTGTTGWFLARQLGFLDLNYPQFYWVAAALAIVIVLSIQGLAVLLPTNLLIYFEVQKPSIDDAKVARWMRRYVRVVASQGLGQVAIIVIMSRFATGL
jgi:hypothetical protein